MPKEITLKDNEPEKQYWWLNANPKFWRFDEFDVGDIQSYTLYTDDKKKSKRRIYQNFIDAKKDDIVIGYQSYPCKQITALAKISEEQNGEELLFEITELLDCPIDYDDLMIGPELSQMEFIVKNKIGSLFKLTKNEYDFIINKIRHNTVIESYTKNDFLQDVYMPEKAYDKLVSLLVKKKNIILQGAPGVGKTYAANRLAYSIIGKKDKNRILMVQFHQSYSYEDFIMGYRPTESGFKLAYGAFYEFCKKAEEDINNDYFCIIDEINRGNLSKIFGELLMLIENDKRGLKLRLLYSDEMFSVPNNVYIIGMMNTADRSLAMIDYALRRRFAFFQMNPSFQTDGFKAYQQTLKSSKFDKLIACIEQLNKDIQTDETLGEGFCIGHSYFCNLSTIDQDTLESIIEYEIIPLLNEYWFDEPSKIENWSNELKDAIK